MIPYALLLTQSRLAGMPGAAEYGAAQKAWLGVYQAVELGRWTDATHFTYRIGPVGYTLNAATLESSREKDEVAPGPSPLPVQPARGRQWDTVTSKDGKLKAHYEKNNIALTGPAGTVMVTQDGNPATRVKYGTGSWVYGEELEQRDAMGFSPDGKYLWYYRFDESKVLDYFLTTGQTSPQDALYPEAYPKPGKPNPMVDLFVYDVRQKKSFKVPVRSGAFDDGMGHYVYGISWDQDGKELYYTRANRVQNDIEFCRYDVAANASKTLRREYYPQGWVDSEPPIIVDRNYNSATPRVGDEIQVKTEESGWINYSWLNLKTGAERPITLGEHEGISMLGEDQSRHRWLYLAWDGAHPHHQQLYAAPEGQAGVSITDESLNHTVSLSPDDKYIADLAQSADTPPTLRLLDAEGKLLKVVATTDPAEAVKGGFRPRKLVQFPAADGKTTLYGTIDFPHNFDPNKKYPVLLGVYGGPLPPAWGAYADNYMIGHGMQDYGFLVVNIQGRGTSGRGRAFREAIFHQMGRVEIDDQATGIRAIEKLPYVDSQRVGVFGTSYGGYSSCMLLLRYPDLFQASCSCSMVSDWRNYDTTYTERYMGLLPDQTASYDASALRTYAKDLKGWLMLYYGTADDNTHPTNTLQLIQALQNSGKYFEVQVGVDRGHSGVDDRRMMEFFIERLVMSPPLK